MTSFEGFSPKTIAFFNTLKKNNSKEWFNAHKQDFTNHVMEPAKTFVTEMGKALKTLSPDIIAIPLVNKSIFRIYRDVRFSPDKSPYKTHLGIFFWEGGRPKMECSGYYFHLEPPNVYLGAGLYQRLYVGKGAKIPEEFFSKDLITYCYDIYSPLKDLHHWLVDLAVFF